METLTTLNQRQLEIIRLLADGRTNAEIAAALHLSPNTVKWYLQQIYQTLGVRNRVEAVAAYRSNGHKGDAAPTAVRGAGLPNATTPLLGRHHELLALTALLQQPDTRLVSVCGLGGAGKTRLALEVGHRLASDFPGGVFLVPLVDARTEDEIWELTRSRLGIGRYSGTSARRLVWEALHEKSVLLIYDTAEHLPNFGRTVNQLLTRARRLKILVTSRVRLNLQAEHVFPLSGIERDTGTDSPAFQLFLQTARRQNPGYAPAAGDLDDIMALCDLVEGLPLALELAGSWTDVLTPGRLVAQLRQDMSRIAPLGTDRPERQQSLWAVFDYSWQQLSTTEKEAAMGLCCLQSPFSREAALSISGAEPATLKRLLQLALLQPAGGDRLAIHELLRLFFAEQARRAGRDLEALADRAMTFFLTQLALEARSLRQTMSVRNLEQLAAGWPHFMAAWQRAIDRRRWDLLEGCVDLAMYYEARGTWTDGDALFAHTQQAVPPECAHLRARLDEARALFALRLYDLRRAQKLADRALATFDREPPAADGAGVYAHIARSAYTYAARGYGAYTRFVAEIDPLTSAHFGVFGRIMPHLFNGTHHCAQQRYERSAALFTAAIDASPADGYHLPALRCMLGLAYLGQGDDDRARAQFKLGLSSGRAIGIYPAQVAAVYELARLDHPDYDNRDLQRALQAVSDDVGGDAQLGRLLIHVGGQYVSFGFFAAARQLFRIGLRVLQGHVSRTEMAATLIVVSKFLAYRLAIAGRGEK